MNKRATVGGDLVRSLVIATIIGIAVFGIVDSLVIYLTEDGETCQAAGDIEDPPAEIIKQALIALAFAAPCALAFAVLLGRRLTHGTTDRLDDVIRAAAKIKGERLDQRLPIGSHDDALDRVATAFNGILARVERGVAAQVQFASDASHELRTPIAVMSTRFEVARRKGRDVGYWEHAADETLVELRRMNGLVDKLLVLSRAGHAGLTHERSDLRALANAAADRVATIAHAKDLVVEVRPGPAIEAEVDPNAIAIVLDNLLRNAIEHAPKGTSIELDVDGGLRPRVVVEDRGPGVPPDSRERIFEPFARGASAETDRSPGSGFGLGLAICKRIVAGHNGTIAVEDRKGGGARFVVALPPPERAPESSV